jgi:para-nitrobenzyl esterase
MQGYWTRFAEAGDPNGEGALEWPDYEASSAEHLVFALPLPLETGSALRSHYCDVLDGVTP